MNDYNVETLEIAAAGRDRVDWVRYHMPVTSSLGDRLAVEKPFDGLRIGISLPLEAKTAFWIETLISAGAIVSIAANPPGSTQDEVAAYLVSEHNLNVYGRRRESYDEHISNCQRLLSTDPHLIVDNGAVLHTLLLTRSEASPELSLIGALEETTTGANTLRRESINLGVPTLVINDTASKRIIENRYGVGPSAVDGLLRNTNLSIAGKRVTVVGYGYCGSGLASCLRALGARICVVDSDPLRRLEAHLEGFETMPIADAVVSADIVFTATGERGAISRSLMRVMRDGALLCNAGYSRFEIDVEWLDQVSSRRRSFGRNIEQFVLDSGQALFLLSNGNPINLAGADGNPIEIMDFGKAIQTLSLEHIVLHGDKLPSGVAAVPDTVERATVEATLRAWTNSG